MKQWAALMIAGGSLWQLATDTLPPQDARNLEDDLGIEKDTPEHGIVEKGALCSAPLKRKWAGQ
jgi:26S proteasome regulatory subunit (ATPase 3-interacting protein)